jgi:hypothetical protein
MYWIGEGEAGRACGRPFPYFGREGDARGRNCGHHGEPAKPAEDKRQESKEPDKATTSNGNGNTSTTPDKTGRELPTVDGATGEITGLQSAINYALGLKDYMTTMLEEVSTRVPSAENTTQSAEAARAQLAANGNGASVLAPITQLQEQMVAAVGGLRNALGPVEAAAAAADTLKAKLEEQLGVREAYAATPDAGDKAFVTGE